MHFLSRCSDCVFLEMHFGFSESFYGRSMSLQIHSLDKIVTKYIIHYETESGKVVLAEYSKYCTDCRSFFVQNLN